VSWKVGDAAAKQVKENAQLLSYCSLKSSRPIIILLISLVPAPISYSLASRSRRPVAYSFTYPLPPKHCIACNIEYKQEKDMVHKLFFSNNT
jgi:hypothetical protein